MRGGKGGLATFESAATFCCLIRFHTPASQKCTTGLGTNAIIQMQLFGILSSDDCTMLLIDPQLGVTVQEGQVDTVWADNCVSQGCQTPIHSGLK